MKKGITKILSACVFAFVVFLAAGTQSKAAVNMGVKQTGAGSSYVDLAWNAQLGAGHYHYSVPAAEVVCGNCPSHQTHQP